ncbi:MAG: lipase family protein [Chloroflexi bacterium]|nr:lipase family protein [Chloroflexota bacterium]
MEINQSNERITEEQRAAARSYFQGEYRVPHPPLKRAAYSDRTAYVMASMAHLAYDRFELGGAARELFETKLNSGGFTLVDPIFHSPETDTQAFLAKNDEYAVLAFRGTEVTKVKDVLTDAKALKASIIEGRVHKGFLIAYNSVKRDIVEKGIPQVLGLPIYITGHSLGGALATVATNDLEETVVNKTVLRDQIAACYTFGSPRVGNQEFNKEFRSAIYRVVNTTDIVTVVPLLSMGYTHIGDVRFLGRGERDIWNGIPILSRLGFFLAAAFRFFGPWVSDHGIVVYREKLAKIAKSRSTKLLFKDARSGGN